MSLLVTLAQRAARYFFSCHMASTLGFCGLLISPSSTARTPSRCAAFGLAGKRYAESCLGMEPVLQCVAEVLVTLVTLVTLAGRKKLAAVDERV